MELRATLFAWYKRQRVARPTQNFTEVQDLTPGMTGTREHPVCKTKGAETKGMLFFLVDLVSSHRNKIEDGGAILELGNLLLRHLEILETSPRRLSKKAHQDHGNKNHNVRASACLC
eukprot:12271443-Alexandrium_andersonii.AAC.1